jgi:regulator of sirC expression with transglutaminase-like and TPR domain
MPCKASSGALETYAHEVPLGLVYLRLGDKQRARTAFERFVALAPSRFSSQVSEARQQLATLQ